MQIVRPDTPRLTNFRKLRPAHLAPQGEALEWLAQVHTEAERSRSGGTFDEAAVRDRMRKFVRRFGCSPDKIATRGHELDETAPGASVGAPIYDVTVDPNGARSHARTVAYARVAASALERLFVDEDIPPRDLVHVTCTGYASPSAAQRFVAKRGWGQRTRVTHAYHMGCYASMPAVRMAAGFLATGAAAAHRRVDVVHNEICTLHVQPADHSPEQLVVQSLFADGHVRYSVRDERGGEGGPPRSPGSSLAVLAMREEVLADSGESMAWMVSDHGMKMTLARDVPQRIAHVVRDFVSALFADAGAAFPQDSAATMFAIHPGGPKVIDVMQQALELSEAQVAASRDVLRECGNMSSATLPHIWMKVLENGDRPVGTPIVSLAFGPGLTLSGAFMVTC